MATRERQVGRTRISAASYAGGRQSPLGVAGSVALHGLVIAAMMVTFSRHLDIIDQSSPIVPVDLVTLSNKTNVRASERVQPKIAPEIKPTPPPVHEQTDTPPPPDQAPSEPLIVKPPPLPTPTEKPQEKPKKAQDKFDLDKLDALLNKVAPTPQRSNARPANRTIKGAGLQDAMTADLVSMLASKIAPCYTPPTGVPHPEDLIVDFDVYLNPDGSVARAPQFLGQTSNTYAVAGKEAALRAIYECAPYKLPPDRYDQWREINPFHFDPRTFEGD
jgi:hypothetical protein